MAKTLYTSKDWVKTFDDPQKAVAYVREIYETNTAFLCDGFASFASDRRVPEAISACYPLVSITVRQKDLRRHEIDPKLSYGFVSQEGTYSTTLTRPDIFGCYYEEMLAALMNNHQVPVRVGVSTTPIPVHFAFPEGVHIEGGLSDEALRTFQETFGMIDLSIIDDRIVDNKGIRDGDERPLALYTAPRVDLSLHRLRHYTGTDPKHFQKFVLFTNYQFYVDEFRSFAMSIMKEAEGGRCPYTSFVEPGNHVIRSQTESATPTRMPQMPAYHLMRADGNGITLINIGIGPSNAKTITDHIAVTRPNAWIMVGHCGGLGSEMKLGDYILAHGYDRRDLVLDSKLPLSTPVPALAEVQQALQTCVRNVTGLSKTEVKTIMRTGTVVTVADRNWELDDHRELIEAFNLSRAVAVDMESATLAANGLRHRVPYGTLLCVSDMPFKGNVKLPGSSEEFYRKRVAQHIRIGIETCKFLCENPEGLHSRKLRGFFETAFR